jgi:protein gp37
MSANTKIEWADHTYNPWIGCSKVSLGCDLCYAKAEWEDRRHRVVWGPGQARSRTKTAGDPVKWNKHHDTFFAEHGRRQRVFCASLADVFDNAVDPQWRTDLFELILATPNLDWLLLTKRIGNVGNMLPVPFDFDKHYPNVWLGATIVNQEEANRDIPKLLAVPAAKRFLSMEPLLGSVDLTGVWRHWNMSACEPGEQPDVMIDWVIAGGESGHGARQSEPCWFRSLRDQCAAADVPFMFKQWGDWAPHDRGQTDSVTLTTPGALDEPLGWFGKKVSGRMLDGRTWDGFPS